MREHGTKITPVCIKFDSFVIRTEIDPSFAFKIRVLK